MAVEASKLGMSSKRGGFLSMGPAGWFICGIGFWIVAFPGYLYYRSKFGVKNYIFGGLASAFVFLGVAVALNVAIELQKSSVLRNLEEVQGTPSAVDVTNRNPSSESVAALAAAKIVDWNWVKDADFGGDGAIKWNVKVTNSSAAYIESVKVEITTYDASEKLIMTDYTFVSSIPPGGTRSESSFADLYGNENDAKIQITEVRFAE
jgi:hypothetical protein